jgi:hypothetical protein
MVTVPNWNETVIGALPWAVIHEARSTASTVIMLMQEVATRDVR